MSLDTQNKFEFIWKIEDYSFHSKDLSAYIDSPTFTASNISGTKWYLHINPQGVNEENKGFLTCSLHYNNTGESLETITVDYTLDILRSDGTVFETRTPARATYSKTNIKSSKWIFMNTEVLAKEMKNWNEDVLTLRCYLTCDGNHRKHPMIGCNARTKIGVDRGTFSWDIRIPSILKWSEWVYFKFSNYLQFDLTITAPCEDIDINIRWRYESASFPLVVKFIITFLDSRGVDVVSKTECCLFQSKDNLSWNLSSFIKKEQLEMDINGAMWNVFTVKGEVLVLSGYSTSKIENFKIGSPFLFESAPTGKKLSKLQNNLQSLFLSKKHSDVKLKVEMVELHAHKNVLSARSPVFAAMFNQAMNENQTGVVEIADVDCETLNRFLEYIYTDNVEKIDYESAKKLLIIADKYEVLPLKDICASLLISDLSIENACEITIIADMVNDDRFKKSVFNYIKANADEILSLPDWLLFIENHSKLATEVLITLSRALITKKT